jgi:hypothetical protein
MRGAAQRALTVQLRREHAPRSIKDGKRRSLRLLAIDRADHIAQHAPVGIARARLSEPGLSEQQRQILHTLLQAGVR